MAEGAGPETITTAQGGAMNERVVMWIGRLIGLFVALMIVADTVFDHHLSQRSRTMVIGIAALSFCWVFLRQCQIAYKYEGIPLRPFPFRWVVSAFFGATALLMLWMLLVSVFPHLYNPTASAIFWLIFIEGVLWFMGRWITVGRPQLAGPGETGTN